MGSVTPSSATWEEAGTALDAGVLAAVPELPQADGVVLKDSSADPQAEAVETTGADAVAAAINAGPDNWTVYNTTLVVQGGRVQEVRRIWVP